LLAIEGPKGKLSWTLPKSITAKVDGQTLSVERVSDNRQDRALHGLSRALLANMVTGVTEGFKREMEIHGVGFKAAVQGQNLNLNLGKSHPIVFNIPAEVKITVADNTKITIEGIDNQLVGQCAADIRAYYPPEPYKGKGVRFVGEQIRRKEGKTVQ
jgi:ribosomal protein L6, bacterial type